VAALVVGLWIDDELPSPVATPPDANTALVVTLPSPHRPSAAQRNRVPPLLRQTLARPVATGDGLTPALARAAPIRQGQEDAADASKADRLGREGAAAGGGQAHAPVPKTEFRRPKAAPAAASPGADAKVTHQADSAAQSAQWTWQPPGATAPRPVDADGEAWLLRLVQTARGRWVEVAVPRIPAARPRCDGGATVNRMRACASKPAACAGSRRAVASALLRSSRLHWSGCAASEAAVRACAAALPRRGSRSIAALR
jgi:hypothetical protein